MYVYLTRTEEVDDTEIKMELYESEITHRYLASSISDFDDDSRDVKFEWSGFGGKCTKEDKHTDTETAEKKLPDGKIVPYEKKTETLKKCTNDYEINNGNGNRDYALYLKDKYNSSNSDIIPDEKAT